MKLDYVQPLSNFAFKFNLRHYTKSTDGPSKPAPAPDATPEATPSPAPDATPEAAPAPTEATPSPAPDATPEATPSPAPDATPEAAPAPAEATPSPAPDATPEATPAPAPAPAATPEAPEVDWAKKSADADAALAAAQGADCASKAGPYTRPLLGST